MIKIHYIEENSIASLNIDAMYNRPLPHFLHCQEIDFLFTTINTIIMIGLSVTLLCSWFIV